MQAIQVAFESIDVNGPEAAELCQPAIQFLKWSRLQPVEAALCVYRGFHEPGVAEHS